MKSSEPDAARLPSAETAATHAAGRHQPRDKVASGAPVTASHTRSVPSRLAEARRRPSADRAKLVTVWVWPRSLPTSDEGIGGSGRPPQPAVSVRVSSRQASSGSSRDGLTAMTSGRRASAAREEAEELDAFAEAAAQHRA